MPLSRPPSRGNSKAYIKLAVTTYEQALEFLDASKELDDGFLITMYNLKVRVIACSFWQRQESRVNSRRLAMKAC